MAERRDRKSLTRTGLGIIETLQGTVKNRSAARPSPIDAVIGDFCFPRQKHQWIINGTTHQIHPKQIRHGLRPYLEKWLGMN